MSPRPVSERTCAFGYCRALVPPGKSRYCSPEHLAASRSRQTAEAAANRASEAVYERIDRGDPPPIKHRGVFVATDGVVLDGAAVLEIRVLMREHAQAMSQVGALIATPGMSLKEVLLTWERIVRNIDRPLLAKLNRFLPEPKHLDQP